MFLQYVDCRSLDIIILLTHKYRVLPLQYAPLYEVLNWHNLLLNWLQ